MMIYFIGVCISLALFTYFIAQGEKNGKIDADDFFNTLMIIGLSAVWFVTWPLLILAISIKIGKDFFKRF
ncbi:hypothetical protein LAh9_66 [Aeromonas phage LAh_9]|uniref:Uncharacterized protein n=2 Tax=Lahexavirus TaxID=2843411 RepID=A0A514A163_9CAUD|nr:hypothetical protein HWC29_gp042 [Aeromonas phage 4_4572]YP_009847547.1 hypothetical protein HWC32_gp066 [Aeromonas phage LAh_9]QDH46975.1 hypothetical protein LAh9_66 [Aeromonas phage LAh_9]QEG09144.1 hypothetical protein [Aeromonas phage 4_4572]